jgi:hypothetical protein
MIISTGMRTDIPAFYSKWFINRIKEGFVYVRNPYYHNQVTKYVLDPKVVDCLCFCTKNPIPILPYLDDIEKFNQFWFVTITPYGKDIEPNVPDKSKVIEAFKQISKRVGLNGIGWRYDPVFYGDGFDRERHIQEFEKIAKELAGYTNSCTISFLDLYEKVKRNAPGIYPPSIEEQMELGKRLAKIAKENGMVIRTCCEGTHLAQFGIDTSGCQTKEVIERAIGLKLNPPHKKNARSICNCLLGQDIGEYNSCGHLCKYCYANMDKKQVTENMKRHDPNSPFLIGHLEKNDKITEAKQVSYLNLQTTLF